MEQFIIDEFKVMIKKYQKRLDQILEILEYRPGMDVIDIRKKAAKAVKEYDAADTKLLDIISKLSDAEQKAIRKDRKYMKLQTGSDLIEEKVMLENRIGILRGHIYCNDRTN